MPPLPKFLKGALILNLREIYKLGKLLMKSLCIRQHSKNGCLGVFFCVVRNLYF